MALTVGSREPVKITETHYTVKSFSDAGKVYHVTKRGNYWYCGCPASLFGRADCKHITEVKEYVKKTSQPAAAWLK